MPVAEYLFLFSGMLDVTSPGLTESAEEKVTRAVQAAALKSVSGPPRSRRGRR